jgi:hypothetical protein
MEVLPSPYHETTEKTTYWDFSVLVYLMMFSQFHYLHQIKWGRDEYLDWVRRPMITTVLRYSLSICKGGSKKTLKYLSRDSCSLDRDNLSIK